MAGPIGRPPAAPVEARPAGLAGAAGAIVGATATAPLGAVVGAALGAAHARDATAVARVGTAPVLAFVDEARTAGQVFAEGYRQGVNEERAKVSQMSDTERLAYFSRAMIYSPGLSGGLKAVVNHFFGD